MDIYVYITEKCISGLHGLFLDSTKWNPKTPTIVLRQITYYGRKGQHVDEPPDFGHRRRHFYATAAHGHLK